MAASQSQPKWVRLTSAATVDNFQTTEMKAFKTREGFLSSSLLCVSLANSQYFSTFELFQKGSSQKKNIYAMIRTYCNWKNPIPQKLSLVDSYIQQKFEIIPVEIIALQKSDDSNRVEMKRAYLDFIFDLFLNDGALLLHIADCFIKICQQLIQIGLCRTKNSIRFLANL